MNEQSNLNSEKPPGKGESKNTEDQSSQPRPDHGQSALESLRSAVHEGAREARIAAEKAAPKIKAALSDATYFIGFGISFASVFTIALTKELAHEFGKSRQRDNAAKPEAAGTETGAGGPAVQAPCPG